MSVKLHHLVEIARPIGYSVKQVNGSNPGVVFTNMDDEKDTFTILGHPNTFSIAQWEQQIKQVLEALS